MRVGLLGCGRIAQLSHATVLARLPGVDVAALADADPQALARCAAICSGAERFTDYRALLERARVDAVAIALPTLLHADAAVAAFERGLHVYLEKPLAASMAEGLQIVQAWRRAGTVGRIGFNGRFNPLYLELRRRIVAGAIGEVLLLRGTFTARWPEHVTWRQQPAAAGGPLLELGSHHVDLCRFLLGTEVAAAHATEWSAERLQAATLDLQMDGGPRAELFCCQGTLEQDRIEVFGREGKLVVDRYDSLRVRQQGKVAVGGLAAGLQRLASEFGGLGYGLAKRRAPAQEPSYAASLRAFVQDARTGERRGPTLDDGLAALRAIESAASAGTLR